VLELKSGGKDNEFFRAMDEFFRNLLVLSKKNFAGVDITH
jgi:hypothetical protein